MTKRQEYRVLRRYADFEVREYLPCVLAEVRVSAEYSDAGGAAFRHLFQYISKGNKNSENIAMTAPVISTQKDYLTSSDEWFVSFVMPSGLTFGRLPHPNDPQVVLREVGSEVCVALSFKGKANQKLSLQKIRDLRMAATKENISMSDESRICRFDPPFKPGFMQYNEIVIPIFLTED
jgi:hypothetical protein